MGGGKRKRRWGTRTKDTGYGARAGEVIRGNLKRGNDGKFTSAGASTPTQRGETFSKAPKPGAPARTTAPKGGKGGGGKGRQAAKPKKAAQTPEQKRAAHAVQQAQNRADVFKQMNIAPDGQQALEALRGGQQPDPQALARGGFVEAGLVEQARDGSYRLTSKGRALLSSADAGDAGRAGAAISSSRDQVGARQERETERTQKKREQDQERAQREQERAAAEKKRQSAGGGGGGTQGAERADRNAERAAEREGKQQAAVEASGLGQQGLADLRQAAESGGVKNDQLTQLGLIGADGMTTDQGRRALAALERGDTRQYQAALQDARARMTREQQAGQRTRESEQKRQAAEADRITRRGWANYRPRTKAQEPQERAMFAKMGGGSGGGGGGGGSKSGGGSSLWKRNPETGKREPTEAQKRDQQQRGVRQQMIPDNKRDAFARRAGDKAESETRKRYTIHKRDELDGPNTWGLTDNNRSTSAYHGVTIATGDRGKVDRALTGKIRAARTRAENEARDRINTKDSIPRPPARNATRINSNLTRRSPYSKTPAGATAGSPARPRRIATATARF
jgi:hypothetical protein